MPEAPLQIAIHTSLRTWAALGRALPLSMCEVSMQAQTGFRL